MRWFLALAGALTVVGAACGGQPAATAPPRAAAGQVYVQTAAEPSIRVVDSASGQVVRTLPAGDPSPDWRWLYRLRGGALDVIDPHAGSVTAMHPAPDWAQVTHSSANGRWLVFSAAGPTGRFQAQDAAWAARPIDVSLPGSFTFDGISGDGQRLYLLERLDGDRYHVRMYDLRAGSLAPYVIVDKTDLAQVMSGTALASFTSHSGMMQLTLYQRDARSSTRFRSDRRCSGRSARTCPGRPPAGASSRRPTAGASMRSTPRAAFWWNWTGRTSDPRACGSSTSP